MDDDAVLTVLRAAADGLAVAASGHLDRPVPTYPGWSVADVVAHTGRIHRWVTGIVRSRADERPRQPELRERPPDLVAWLRDGATAVADALAATPPSTAVWTFAGPPTAGFWRRRMALETTIHRWDVERATGGPTPIADAVAVAGVTEALEVYVLRGLRDADVGGAGEVVGLRTPDGALTCTVRLEPRSIAPLDAADGPPDAWLTGTPTDLWLFTMGRLHRGALTVHGSAAAAALFERSLGLLAPPTR